MPIKEVIFRIRASGVPLPMIRRNIVVAVILRERNIIIIIKTNAGNFGQYNSTDIKFIATCYRRNHAT